MADLPYSCIAVSGDDAFDFLQSQLSNDLELLDRRDSILSAWCNPKGRVICLMQVRKTGDGIALYLPSDLAETVIARLTTFRFRAKVEFDIRPATAGDLGIEGSVEVWQLARLRAGIPEIRAAQSEAFTAHMLNLDLIEALSLDKGCYTGQEIIARTHYRGASRRRLQLFECDAELASGEKVESGGRVVGDVVNVIGSELLAVVPVDAVEPEVDGNPISPRSMSYSLV
jgi:folate-binding protein YgfZ